MGILEKALRRRDEAMGFKEVRAIASHYAHEINRGLALLRDVEKLFNKPVIEWEKDKQLRLKTEPLRMGGGKYRVVILFDLGSGEPICAHLEEYKEDADQ